MPRTTAPRSFQLTAQTSELRCACWSELDLKRGSWEKAGTRPAFDEALFSTRDTTIAGDIRLVFLSPRAVTLLEHIHVLTGKFDLVLAIDAKP